MTNGMHMDERKVVQLSSFVLGCVTCISMLIFIYQSEHVSMLR